MTPEQQPAPPAARPTPRLVVGHDLLGVWRGACAELAIAWRAWCAGDGSWATVSAALDREESAAVALASFRDG